MYKNKQLTKENDRLIEKNDRLIKSNKDLNRKVIVLQNTLPEKSIITRIIERIVPPDPNRCANLTWIVPPKTTSINLKIYSTEGRLVDTIGISNYITLRPHQKLILIPTC